MKKIIYSFFLITLSLIFIIIIYLSTVGIETAKFNNIIISEIKKKYPDIQLLLGKIKIKLNLKKIQISLSTLEPKVIYQDIRVPITKISIYSEISSILKSKKEINQAIISLNNFSIKDIQKLAVRIKPSNFKNYILNNVEKGEIEKISINFKLDKNLNINDYKVNGSVKKVNIKMSKNLPIQDVSLNFISDKNLTLINSIVANYQGISISNGAISLKKDNEIEIDGKFDSKFSFSKDEINELFVKSNIEFLKKNKINAQGTLLHIFSLKIDENFKLIDYEYKSTGSISESQIDLKETLKFNFIEKPISKILISNTNLEINLSKKNKNLLMFDGLYNLGRGLKYKKFRITKDLNKKNSKYLIDLDLIENFFLKFINFESNYRRKSNIKSEINFKNNNIIFNYINFSEGKNTISINELKLNSKKEITSLSSINVLTFKNDRINNNFKIIFKDKISVTGKKIDTSYLLQQLSNSGKANPFKNFTKDIEIKIDSLITKSKIPLSNFILIGRIEKGKFEKLSAKSEFSKINFLDISLKKDENNKKILEVYSDLPQALLSDYKFFEGIRGGKLLYTSVYDKEGSASKMTIEEFKITKAPAFAKLLTLADLGGIADLLSGKGMSFDILEINMTEDNNIRNIEEILALGPSVSVLMEGYIEKKKGLVSLSGTIVPAKTLNSLISKIPIVGSVLVGDKIGDGIFGVSFKMKGLPGKIKTTVNPVKTLTPRFITRALEKMKKKTN